MSKYKSIGRLQSMTRSARFWAAAAVVAVSGLLPALLPGSASAATLTSRKVTIDKSAINSTDVEFAFSYTLINTAATKAGIIYEFCTTPLGTCTLPTGMDVQTANSHDSQASWPTNGTAFAPVSEAADVGQCTLNTNAYMICYSRDEGVATGVTGGAVTHTISGIVAPSSNQSVYVRVHVYSDDDFGGGDLLDEGIVAAAFVNQLTVNGRVAERLDFCVMSIDDDDALPASVSACAALSTTTIDIGIVDNSAVATSPVEPTATNGANDDYGIAMVSTNAAGGVALTYYPQAAGSGSNELRSFRVTGATCNASGTDLTDQCFVDAAGGGTTFVAGNENFGLQIPCIDATQGTTANLGSGGTGAGTAGTYNTAYSNTDDDVSSAGNCESTAVDAGVKFAWNDAGTAAALVSSTNVVDDEIVKLRFGATAQATTPTGSYTVVTNYIATPTF